MASERGVYGLLDACPASEEVNSMLEGLDSVVPSALALPPPALASGSGDAVVDVSILKEDEPIS